MRAMLLATLLTWLPASEKEAAFALSLDLLHDSRTTLPDSLLGIISVRYDDTVVELVIDDLERQGVAIRYQEHEEVNPSPVPITIVAEKIRLIDLLAILVNTGYYGVDIYTDGSIRVRRLTR